MTRAAVPLALAAGLAGAPGRAEQAPDPLAFGTAAEGRVVSYAAPGEPPHQIERFHPNRRVTLLFVATGACWDGEWYDAEIGGEPAICFAYAPDPGPHCSRIAMGEDGLRFDGFGGSGPVEVSFLDGADGAAFACGYLGS